MFKWFKELKEVLKRLKALENRMLKLEQQHLEMWEETHPRTMGGK